MFVSNNPEHSIKRILIGKLCERQNQTPRFQIVIHFEDEELRSELISTKDILDRVNLWESVKGWNADKARQYMIESVFGLLFGWPKSVWGVPLKVKSFEVFYCDAKGLKHHTTLGEV